MMASLQIFWRLSHSARISLKNWTVLDEVMLNFQRTRCMYCGSTYELIQTLLLSTMTTTTTWTIIIHLSCNNEYYSQAIIIIIIRIIMRTCRRQLITTLSASFTLISCSPRLLNTEHWFYYTLAAEKPNSWINSKFKTNVTSANNKHTNTQTQCIIK